MYMFYCTNRLSAGDIKSLWSVCADTDSWGHQQFKEDRIFKGDNLINESRSNVSCWIFNSSKQKLQIINNVYCNITLTLYLRRVSDANSKITQSSKCTVNETSDQLLWVVQVLGPDVRDEPVLSVSLPLCAAPFVQVNAGVRLESLSDRCLEERCDPESTIGESYTTLTCCRISKTKTSFKAIMISPGILHLIFQVF